MNPVSIIIGVLAISYGIYTAYVRSTNPDKFDKLLAMKNQWGDGVGNTVHLFFYTIVPILVGIGALIVGITGKSIFSK